MFVASAFRTIPGTLNIFRKIAWQKNSFYPHYPRHFQNVHKKCLTKNSLHPHVPRHILFFQKKFLTKSVIYFCTSPGIISSAVSSLVTLHLWRKKCLGKKKCLGCSIPASRILYRPACPCLLAPPCMCDQFHNDDYD